MVFLALLAGGIVAIITIAKAPYAFQKYFLHVTVPVHVPVQVEYTCICKST